MRVWHHDFNKSLGSHHTPILIFINFLKKEQEEKVEKINLGEINPAKKRKYKDFDKRLKNVVQNYDYTNFLNYIKDIAQL